MLAMKNLFLSAFLTLTCATLFAQTEASTSKANPTKTLDTTAMAKVYVIRSTGHVGSGVNLRVLVDDAMKCKVRNNRYAVVFVEPGTHLFNATSWDKPGASEKTALKVPVEAGKTYYMSVHLKQRFVGIDIWLEEITTNTATPLLAKYKRDECD